MLREEGAGGEALLEEGWWPEEVMTAASWRGGLSAADAVCWAEPCACSDLRPLQSPGPTSPC